MSFWLIFCSDAHMRNISCPVSPIGSPLLFSSPPQHINGRMSPSPISSPRTMSGASTPLTGGNGALPFNHPKQPLRLQKGLRSTANDPHPWCDLFDGMPLSSPPAIVRERMNPDGDIVGLKLGSQRYDLYETYERRPAFVDHLSHHILRDHVKLNPSLDLHPRSPNMSRVHGI